jgi:hypothetical protein
MTPVNLFTGFSTFGAKDGGELTEVDFQGDVLKDDPGQSIYKFQYLWSQGQR